MNKKIIKIFKLNIYNTDYSNNSQNIQKIYYILLYYIYLFNHIYSEKVIKKNRKKI